MLEREIQTHDLFILLSPLYHQTNLISLLNFIFFIAIECVDQLSLQLSFIVLSQIKLSLLNSRGIESPAMQLC